MVAMRLGAGAVLLVLAACGGLEVRSLAHSPAAGQAASAEPSLATDPAQRDLLVSWVGDDGTGWRVWLARSSDGGETWSPPVRVTSDTGEVKPMVRPRRVSSPAQAGDSRSCGREMSRWPAGSSRRAPSGSRGRATAAARGAGSYPQILSVSDTVAVVAYTLERDDRREVRLARAVVSR